MNYKLTESAAPKGFWLALEPENETGPQIWNRMLYLTECFDMIEGTASAHVGHNNVIVRVEPTCSLMQVRTEIIELVGKSPREICIETV